MNNYSPSSEDQPRKHKKVPGEEQKTSKMFPKSIFANVLKKPPCASDPCKEKNTREDKDDIEGKEGGEEHLAEELHLWDLILS